MKQKSSTIYFVMLFTLISINTYAAGDSEAQEKIFIGAVLGIAVVLFGFIRDKLSSKKNPKDRNK